GDLAGVILGPFTRAPTADARACARLLRTAPAAHARPARFPARRRRPETAAWPHPMARRWQTMSDERLLDLRLCDLDLHIEGSPVEARTVRLDAELEEKGLRFRPHYWVGAEWFTPDGVPGIAVPFYLVHPR